MTEPHSAIGLRSPHACHSKDAGSWRVVPTVAARTPDIRWPPPPQEVTRHVPSPPPPDRQWPSAAGSRALCVCVCVGTLLARAAVLQWRRHVPAAAAATQGRPPAAFCAGEGPAGGRGTPGVTAAPGAGHAPGDARVGRSPSGHRKPHLVRRTARDQMGALFLKGGGYLWLGRDGEGRERERESV